MPFGEFKVQFLFCLGLLFEDTFSTTGPPLSTIFEFR